jgi:hypothetical protein
MMIRPSPPSARKVCAPGKLEPPKKEAEIMRAWGNLSVPCVSVCCATHNHVLYLEDALCGFLAQRTTFPFEIIIRDDASTDGTTEIAKKYSRLYPNIIRLVIEKENQWRKGIRPMRAWPALAKGDFVALCEGDDYWIHPEKLQKQVGLLNAYSDAVMSVANTLAYKQKGDQLTFVRTWGAHDKVLQGFEEVKAHYFHTSTLVIRREVLAEVVGRYFYNQALFGDTALQAILVSYGPFALFPEFVSVYRETGFGAWSSLSRIQQLQGEINVSKKLSPLLSGKYRKYQEEKVCALCRLKFVEAKKIVSLNELLLILPCIIKCAVIEIFSKIREFLRVTLSGGG